ncbi:hypothetical protein BGZ81_005342 [Podila clonocystis]|nr:hypothetical protein BGZ81_005342 [Podila clonocystis]
MKTRTGIGLEEEIVYDRTITIMMEGQRKLLEEQRLRELEINMQRQAQLNHQQHLHQQQNKASASEALKRLFMVGKQHPTQHVQQQECTSSGYTFADCAGEINGCETYRIPGMRDRQAFIAVCTFCLRPQCQFCAIRCTRCQELSCRACSVASYEHSDVEYFCSGCRN